MPLTIRNNNNQLERIIKLVKPRSQGWVVVRTKDGIRLVHRSEIRR